MEVELIFKNYGRGKERIILIDKSNNMAIVSFGIKDPPYNYLKEKYDQENEVVPEINSTIKQENYENSGK